MELWMAVVKMMMTMIFKKKILIKYNYIKSIIILINIQKILIEIQHELKIE